MTGCPICLGELSDGEAFHVKCAEALFGTQHLPRLDVSPERLSELGVEMITVGHGSISGTQPKVLVDVSPDGDRLEIAIGRSGPFILKPQTSAFPYLPENEHLSMRLAERAGVPIPPCGILPLIGGELAYVVQRFDRRRGSPSKLRQEDFCQLTSQRADDKYQGSAEQCVKVIRQFSTSPDEDVLRLFRLLFVAYLSGNGDLHLKNFSLFTDEANRVSLTPAYDLVCTALVLPNDQLALPIRGKKDRIKWKTWLEFAAYCKISQAVAVQIRNEVLVAMTEHAETLLAASALPVNEQARYGKILELRIDSLAISDDRTT